MTTTTTEAHPMQIPMLCRACGHVWIRHWLGLVTPAPCPSCGSVDLKVDDERGEAPQ